MLSTPSPHNRSGARLRLVAQRRAAPPSDDGWHVTTTDSAAELGRDWLDACEKRVRGRLESCQPLDGMRAPVGLDAEGSPPNGLPAILAQALSALRVWRGRTLPTVQRDHLRVPAGADRCRG